MIFYSPVALPIFTLIFSSEFQIHFKIIIIFSAGAEMLLWFLKDQRVYLHNVLF